jgi:hypothetical protein
MTTLKAYVLLQERGTNDKSIFLTNQKIYTDNILIGH